MLAPGVNAKGGRYLLEAQGNNLVIHIRHGGRYEFEPCESPATWRYRLAAVYNARGDKMSVNYPAGNNLITNIVGAAGNVFTFCHSAAGQLTQVRDETGDRAAFFQYTGDQVPHLVLVISAVVRPPGVVLGAGVVLLIGHQLLLLLPSNRGQTGTMSTMPAKDGTARGQKDQLNNKFIVFA